MPLKVTWKKGMRLSTDVFEALDNSIIEALRYSNLMATGGRMGLLRAGKPFDVSVNISNGLLEVVSLTCQGVTKSGRIVDIDFDSNFTHTFDTRIAIPNATDEETFILVVKLYEKQWREVNEMMSEHYYTFELINENSAVDSDSLPIGRLINHYGWRLDEGGFVPPCLYINAHPKYVEIEKRAKLTLKTLSARCKEASESIARQLLTSLWPTVENCRIEIDTMQGQSTPRGLFAAIQKVVMGFASGCAVDEYISLEDAETYFAYGQKPYNAKSLYDDIREGLELCDEISIKMEAVGKLKQERVAPPAPEEKPAPKPQPAPEPQPQPKGRNRWAGIEI